MYNAARFGRQLLSRALASIVISTTSATTMPNDGHPSASDSTLALDRLATSDGCTYRRHPRFWRDDGTLVIAYLDDAFKVNSTLPQLQSPVLSSLAEEHGVELVEGCPLVRIPDKLGVRGEDLEAILDHVYHDK